MVLCGEVTWGIEPKLVRRFTRKTTQNVRCYTKENGKRCRPEVGNAFQGAKFQRRQVLERARTQYTAVPRCTCGPQRMKHPFTAMRSKVACIDLDARAGLGHYRKPADAYCPLMHT